MNIGDETKNDRIQGYACLAVATTLSAVIMTIMIASIVHWITT